MNRISATGAAELGLGLAQRPRLLARRPHRQEGRAAARLADDLEGGAVAARAVAAEAGAVEDQRLEVGLDVGAVAGEMHGERRQPRAAGGEAVEQRPGRLGQRLDARAVDQELAGGGVAPRGVRAAAGDRQPPREEQDEPEGGDGADQRRGQGFRGFAEPAEGGPVGQRQVGDIHPGGALLHASRSEATRLKDVLTMRNAPSVRTRQPFPFLLPDGARDCGGSKGTFRPLVAHAAPDRPSEPSGPTRQGGPVWKPITRKVRALFHADQHSILAERPSPCHRSLEADQRDGW